MPKDIDHIELANKNHDAMMHLVKDHLRFSEWITTIAFYKAVQVVEAACYHTKGKGCCGHEHRLRVLETHPFNTTKLFHHHRSLWNESSVARYLYHRDAKTTYSSFSDRIKPELVVKKIIQDRLLPLESIACSFMSSAAVAALRKVHVPDLP